MEHCMKIAFAEHPKKLAKKANVGHIGRLQGDFRAAINSLYPGFSSIQPIYSQGLKTPMTTLPENCR